MQHYITTTNTLPTNINCTFNAKTNTNTITFSAADYLDSSNAIGCLLNEVYDRNHPVITKIEVLVPNKVLRFTFQHGTQIKTVCNNEDAFDFEFAIYLAFAKLFYKQTYTREGIEYKAHSMKYIKFWVKKVKEAVRTYKKQEKERIKKEREEAERAAARKRQAEKKARKKRERKERQLAAIAEKVKMM